MAKKLPKLDRAFLEKHAQDRFNASVNWRDQNIKQEWLDENDQYDSNFSAKERKKSDVLIGQGRLFIPKTYSHIQRILVDILDAYFTDPEEIVDVVAWKSIPTETLKIVKSLLNYRLNSHPIDFYQEAYEAVLDALKNKVGIMKVFPEITTENEIQEDPETGEIIEQEVISDYKPIIETLPYEDVFFDSRATWKDYWKHTVIHRMKKSIDELKRKKYKNLSEVEGMVDNETDTDEIKAQRALDQDSPFTDEVDPALDTAGIYVYEVWTFLDHDRDGLLESVSYLMAGDSREPKILIRDVEPNTLPYANGRNPIVVGQALPEPHKMYGKSLTGILSGLQKETNAIRNQDREAVAMSIRRPLLVARGANVDLSSLLNRRIAGVVMGDDISDGAVRELPLSDITSGTVQHQARVDQDFSELSSISPNRLGATSNPEETATGVQANESNANKKVFQLTRNLTYTLFRPVFKMLLALEQEYESDEFIQLVTGRVLGFEFAQDGNPPREFIQGEFDLTINVSVSKQTQLNRLLTLMQQATQANASMAQMVSAGIVPPEKVEFVNPMIFFKRIAPIVGEKNIEEFLIRAQAPPAPAAPKGQASQPSQNGQQGIEAELLNQGAAFG
jgi:hypothetical protein